MDWWLFVIAAGVIVAVLVVYGYVVGGRGADGPQG